MSCKHGTLDVCMVNKLRKYHSMCKMVDSVLLPLRNNREYFVKYQNILIVNPTGGLKYGERQLEDIWRWVCRSQVYGHNRCKTVVGQLYSVQYKGTFGAPDKGQTLYV